MNSVQIVGMFVVAVLTITFYAAMPTIGGFVLIALDRAAFGMRWLGAGVPAVAWGLGGAIFGGFAGTMMGLRRAGAPRRAPRVLIGALAALAALYVLGFVYSATMRPVDVAPPPPRANRTEIIQIYSGVAREP